MANRRAARSGANRTVRIDIFCHQPYPRGMACTNRIHLYARGFVEAGHDCRVLMGTPSETPRTAERNTRVEGEHEGVPFRYLCGRTDSPAGWLSRRRVGVYGLMRSVAEVWRSHPPADVVFCYTWDTASLLAMAGVAKRLGAPLVGERTEFPFYKRGANLRPWHRLHIRWAPRLFDGILVISEPLRAFFQHRIRADASLLTIPPLVDCREFDRCDGTPQPNRIAYCGDLSQSKDGLHTLLHAVAKAHEKGDVLQLELAGKGKPADEAAARDLAGRLGIAEHVRFLGYLSRPDLVRHLKSATALVLAKPAGHQADYCFPSKLAEFLATGNPVVVTATGEIPRFLTDRKDALLVPPGEPDALAGAIGEAAAGGQETRDIGQRGREAALKHFDYRANVRRVVQWLDELGSRSPLVRSAPPPRQ